MGQTKSKAGSVGWFPTSHTQLVPAAVVPPPTAPTTPPKQVNDSKVNESLLSRITEVNKEKLDPLPPIKRWLRNTQVTSIEEATNGIPIPYIEDEVETAKNYAIRKKKELTETNLTVDEIAALILYTSEWPTSSGENQSLYFQLNKWLREADRSAAVPFFKYLVLLLSGLSKIPPCDGIMLYRGVRQDLRALYQSKKDKNMTVIWNGLSSSTIKLGVLQDFLGNSGQGTMFHIHSKTARKISDFSVFQKEEEALFFPLSQFDIDSLFVHGDLTIVSLQEVDPIESLTSLFSNVTLVQSPSPTRGRAGEGEERGRIPVPTPLVGDLQAYYSRDDSSPYMKALMVSYKQLKDDPKNFYMGVVYRKTKLTEKGLGFYKPGQQFVWSAFTSTTIDPHPSGEFGLVLFVITIPEKFKKYALCLENDCFPTEREVLLLPNIGYKVQSIDVGPTKEYPNTSHIIKVVMSYVCVAI